MSIVSEKVEKNGRIRKKNALWQQKFLLFTAITVSHVIIIIIFFFEGLYFQETFFQKTCDFVCPYPGSNFLPFVFSEFK